MPEVLTRAEIAEKIRKIAAEQVGADPAAITDNTQFQADLNYDSLDLVEFTMLIEDAFGLSISDEQADVVRTVGEAVDLVCVTAGLTPDTAA